jgi:hypothetical protein
MMNVEVKVKIHFLFKKTGISEPIPKRVKFEDPWE